MKVGNVISDLAFSVSAALLQDLPAVEYTQRLPGSQETKQCTRRPRAEEVEVYHFPQLWESTALGFGGVGGSSMTTANTTVVMLPTSRFCAVYFAGRLAYVVRANNAFMVDLHHHNMKSVSEVAAYYGDEYL